MTRIKPALYTSLSPALLNNYSLQDAIVVVIDVLRATSTIATALYNGASSVVPVDDIQQCIRLGEALSGITAGERDGKIADGLSYGNSPFEYPPKFIKGKTLVLTTTNGTKLLHMALANGASRIITGSFPNFSSVCDYIRSEQKDVVLACAAWRDKVNIEDTLFAGAVVNEVWDDFVVNCDSSKVAKNLYLSAQSDLFAFLRDQNASHFQRLSGFGLEDDIRYCLTADIANVLPLYVNDKLVNYEPQPVVQ
jgi:2-phosphosulfolactate phosphatase